MNPPYSASVWADVIPKYIENLIAAAGSVGSRLVVLKAYTCWGVLVGTQVNVKDAQGLMRHSRASTTQDIYQVVPDSQRKAVKKLTAFVKSRLQQRCRCSKCGEVQPNATN